MTVARSCGSTFERTTLVRSLFGGTLHHAWCQFMIGSTSCVRACVCVCVCVCACGKSCLVGEKKRSSGKQYRAGLFLIFTPTPIHAARARDFADVPSVRAARARVSVLVCADAFIHSLYIAKRSALVFCFVTTRVQSTALCKCKSTQAPSNALGGVQTVVHASEFYTCDVGLESVDSIGRQQSNVPFSKAQAGLGRSRLLSYADEYNHVEKSNMDATVWPSARS